MKKESGLQFTSVLLLVFIVLKLCKLIDWAWWCVLSPFWIPLSLAVFFYSLYLLFRNSEVKNKQPRTKSKWQEKMEQMQARQEAYNKKS